MSKFTDLVDDILSKPFKVGMLEYVFMPVAEGSVTVTPDMLIVCGYGASVLGEKLYESALDVIAVALEPIMSANGVEDGEELVATLTQGMYTMADEVGTKNLMYLSNSLKELESNG